MRFRGLGRVRRVARRVADAFVPRVVILLYHRVAELPADPQLLSVRPRHFGEHLQVIRQFGEPMALRSLPKALANGSGGQAKVVVTFDDGYADNLYNAKPLLERNDVPATVFVTSGYLGSKSGFWKDVLNTIFLQPGRLPQTLRLWINGSVHQWELGDGTEYRVEDFERYRHWDIGASTDPTMRQQLYRSLCQRLRTTSHSDRENVLKELIDWAGTKSDDSCNRILSEEEVVRLADGGLVEVGSHTVTHPVLSSLTVVAQQEEIRHSKQCLENILRQRVDSFAYPYGGRSHYSADTVAAVRQSGFQLACSNFDGVVRRGADRYQLPRFLVRDWDGDEFATRLTDWLSD